MSYPSTLSRTLPSIIVFATMAACNPGLTREEAKTSLEEIQLASQAQALTSNGIELSTRFTIGDAVESAAEELGAFIRSQLPCADVSIEAETGSATIDVEYGANSGSCLYRGQRFSGRHTITITRNDRTSVVVRHRWVDFGNDTLLVNGEATVDWDFENRFRHVVHEAEWTRLSDGRTGTGSGDRTQRPLEGGIAVGFSVDGNRTWSGERGDWDLAIDDVEMRWVDPVPQSGTYTLDTPFDKRVTLGFERVSPTSIQVTIAGPKRSFDFQVTTLRDGGSKTEAMDGDAG